MCNWRHKRILVSLAQIPKLLDEGADLCLFVLTVASLPGTLYNHHVIVTNEHYTISQQPQIETWRKYTGKVPRHTSRYL